MLINGHSTEVVSALDRGLAYGDGVFETVAIREGRPELWPEHMARLKAGCERLTIPFPEEVVEEGAALCEGVTLGVLKVIVTRGAGGRGYRPPEEPHPTRVISVHPWPDYPKTWWREGVVVRWCETPLSGNPRLARIKHLNRLEQVLARAEWSDPGIAEGVMRDTDGRVVEGVMSNLFVVRDGVLSTPALERCGVAGVMRDQIIALSSQLGIPCREAALSVSEVMDAEELFLTNSVIGIWPVKRVGERSLPVGELSLRLQAALRARGVIR